MTRREFLSWVVMGGSLTLSYGLLAAFGVRYLYPTGKSKKNELFVTTLGELTGNQPLTWTAPDGQKVIINKTDDGLMALSNICPHLGCKVHWEDVNQRFFCPCHSGAFDKNGIATEGPPKKENKNLKKYDLNVINGAIYLQWETI